MFNQSFQEWTHEQFRALLEAAPDATVIADQQGTIILVNAQTEPIFGYTRDELLGQPIEGLFPDRYRRRHVHHRHDYANAPRIRPMGTGRELYGLRKDGSEFPVEISLSPFPTNTGVVVFSAIRDITPQKTVQNELREAKEKLETRVQERTAELVMANAKLCRRKSPSANWPCARFAGGWSWRRPCPSSLPIGFRCSR